MNIVYSIEVVRRIGEEYAKEEEEVTITEEMLWGVLAQWVRENKGKDAEIHTIVLDRVCIE